MKRPRPAHPAPRASGKRRSLLAGGAVLALLAAGVAISQTLPSQTSGQASSEPAATPLHLPTDYAPTPSRFLQQSAPADAAANDPVARGRYLAIAGDCVACHTAEGEAPFSGGRAINTPFGVIYSSNLTTGIGSYTPDTFWRALREGKDDDGSNLYPAFPYNYFTRISRADSDALYAFLKTVPPVRRKPPANKLPFPLNLRFMISGWNLLFFKPAGWTPRTDRSPLWNRGSYLVEVLGHCGACHTPKNILGADKEGQALQGGLLDNWFAPNLTGQPRFGLGGWSEDDIVRYLKTGRNDRAHATGPMGEVVTDSTALMADSDLRAMATYLKSLPNGGDVPPVAAPDPRAMQAGAAIYFDTCTGCHRDGGVGVPGFFPVLKGHTGVQQPDPTNTIRVILEGARTAPTEAMPTPLSMPSFAWKLTDEQIADLATYVRNSWGNQAPTVSPAQVRKLRDVLRPQSTRLEPR